MGGINKDALDVLFFGKPKESPADNETLYREIAENLYQVYRTHIDAGFSKKQAFELVKLSIEVFN